MKYPRYQNYKDSEVEWLGKVPEEWEITSCRSLLHEQNSKNETCQNEFYLSLVAQRGVIPYEEKGDIGNKKPDDLSKCKIVSCGDLVINSMNFGIGSFGLSSYDGICSPVYIVLSKSENNNLNFIFRLFENKSFQIYAQSFGNGILSHRAAISWDLVKNLKVPVPLLKVQDSIAIFLEHETAKIDNLLAQQETLIVLLQEKRQAVISHAVTKGLNPDVPMKDSGIEWLGEIPGDWEVGSLKEIISIVESGTSVNAIDVPATSDEIGVLKTSCVYTGVFNPTENKVVIFDEIDRVSCPLKENTLIVSRMNTPELVGAAGVVGKAQNNIFLPDRLWQVHISKSNVYFVIIICKHWPIELKLKGHVVEQAPVCKIFHKINLKVSFYPCHQSLSNRR